MTVPEIRRLICRLVWAKLPTHYFTLMWSVWRRRHQQIAQDYHYKRRLVLYQARLCQPVLQTQ